MDDAVDGLGGVQMTGVVNSLKTGNVVFDMMIAMTIPIVLKFAFGGILYVQQAAAKHDWTRWWTKRQKLHERRIVHRSIISPYSTRNVDEESHNDVLIRAVQLYVHARGFLRLQVAEMTLTAMVSKGSLGDGDFYRYDSDVEDSSSKSFAGMLSGLQIVKNPPDNEWHDIGSFGEKDDPASFHLVSMNIGSDVEPIDGKDGGSGKQDCTTTLHLRSRGKNSIEAFVNGAYKWYVEEMKKQDDDSRYMYEVISDGEDYDYHRRKYKRYKLSDEKTFESLFFREKEDLLGIIKHFTEKSGKYAIKGYPHKLGLLLHGPPGTGKTSLIKAIAHMTGRSIVNVPLAKISTNSELMSIFFDGKYDVEGECVPFKLGFEDVIFVLEDVDAASSIVRRRDGKKTADVTYTEHVELPPPKSIWRLFLESPEESCRELVELLMEKSGRLKEDAVKVLPTLAQRPLQSVPGLSVFGEGGACSGKASDVLDRISAETVQRAEGIMDSCETVDRYLGLYAGNIKAIIDAGADVDKELEDAMLGISALTSGAGNGLFPPKPKGISRDVSYKKYAEDDNLHVEVSPSVDATMRDIAAMLTGKAGKNEDAANTLGNAKSKDLSSLARSNKNVGGPENLSPFLNQEYLKGGKDKLNLSGLLNVLDGVVDTPGRMVIMTTNHPEMLDPALIRPGRIDKKLMLGYMHPFDVAEMIEHYFQESLSPMHRQRIEAAISGDEVRHRPAVNLTPAQIEQYACEWSFVEEMVRAIEKKGKVVDTEKTRVTSGSVTFDS